MTRLCFFALLLFITALQAQNRYAGASQELGVGARALALGDATVALSGDGNLFYYNPATAGYVEKPLIMLMYAPSFGSIASPLAFYHHAGVIFPLRGDASLGLSWTRFSVENIPVFPDLAGSSFADRLFNRELRPTGEPVEEFKDTEDVYYFTFSKMLKTDLSLGWLFIDLPVKVPLGINVKLMRQKLYTASASGLGIDIGGQFSFPLGVLLDKRILGEVVLAYSIQDITRTAIVWDNNHEDHIETTHRLGAAYHQNIGRAGMQMRAYWSRYEKYDSLYLYGLEWLYKGQALRLGRNRNGLTAGAGFSFWRLNVDYAFVAIELENSHRLSCAIHF